MSERAIAAIGTVRSHRKMSETKYLPPLPFGHVDVGGGIAVRLKMAASKAAATHAANIERRYTGSA
jgi:hypothetical protein